MRCAVLPVRTQRQQRRSRRMLEAGRGARAEQMPGLDRVDAFVHGWIDAIGTGQTPARCIAVSDMSEKKEGSKLDKNGVVTHARSGPRAVCANTSRGNRSIAIATSWTPNTEGASLIAATIAGKEKDRCANTGLLRQDHVDVTFGIRSDNRQTA